MDRAARHPCRRVITGSQDVVWGNGVLGVVSAYAKGAPVRILGSNIRGVQDLYWYVKTDSPIKSFKDLNGGKQMAYSRPGSTTDLAARFIAAAQNIKAKIRIGRWAFRIAYPAYVWSG